MVLETSGWPVWAAVMVTTAATSSLRDFFSVVFLTGVIFYQDWKMAIFALFILPAAFYPIVYFGRKVRKLSTGCQEAMACLDSSCPPDVVILDLNMPKVNGLQCLHYIKEKQPQVPVIMLTGHASVDTGVEGIRLGAFDYCLKPIELEELLEKIHLAIRSA